jgi:tetratricopeptide (TPR) repeat protein
MRKKKKHSHKSPVETCPAKAADLLAKGHYKEAIEAYKNLLKKEQREEWHAALAKAYLLRAQALANKDMYKEAAVLWENRANLCDDKELLDQYIYWLIRAGRYGRAAGLLTETSEHLPETMTRQLQAQFGALLLGGHQEVAAAVQEDAVLLKQYALMMAALKTYYQGDDKGTEESLKQISFRSPYRDFRAIMKALLTMASDSSGASQLLEKVPADSPYAYFAELIRMAGQGGETLLAGLSKLSRHEQAFIAHLKGWDKAQLKVISALQIAAKRDNHKALMEVVTAHRQSLGEQYCRQFCLALLPSYPAGMKFYEQAFGLLSTFEKNRITALSHEQLGHSLRAEKHWRLCVDSLKQYRKQEDNALKRALILRHIVELAEKRGDAFDEEEVPNDLAESLRLDPDDKKSYLKLIQWYKHNDEQKNYNQWVETAVKQFPKESEVLLIAMEAATGRKAFKKAAGFAKNLLKVDPINVKARQIARTSHISHARKLIKSGKYELARKELELAAQLEKTSKPSGVVQINQALLELQAEGFVKPKTRRRKNQKSTIDDATKPNPTGQVIQATELLKEGVLLSGDGMLGQFRAIVESKSQSLEPANILSFLPELKKDYLSTRQEVLELVNLINVYSEEGLTFLNKAVELIKAPFQNAVKLDFSQDEMLSVCQCLKKLEHNGLLKTFAEQGLKRWAEHPAFIFYQIYSKVKGMSWHISMPDVDRLKEAADKAERQGDQRTAMMIMGFLNKIGGGIMPPFFNDPDDDDDFFFPFDDDDVDNLDELKVEIESLEKMDLENMSPAEVIRILNRLEDMGIEIPDFGVPIPRLPRKKKKKPKKR